MNRCEREAVVQTQDCKVSKMGCFAASSQWDFADEICDCTLVWVRWVVEVLLCLEKAFLCRLALHEMKTLTFFCTQKAFLLQVVLHELKNPPFPQNKTFSFAENLPKHPQKQRFSAYQTLFHLHKPFFSVLKRHPILQTKNFRFEQAFPCYSQKPAFFEPKAFLLYKPFRIAIPSNSFPPSISHSHPAITYCPQRTRPFFCSPL